MSTTDSPHIYGDIEKAIRAFKKGKITEAQGLFSGLLDCDISHPQNLFRMGQLALLLGEDAHAAHALSTLVRAHPDNGQYVDALAQALLNTGATTAAADLLRKAVDNKTEYVGPYVTLAHIELLLGHPQDSIPLLDSALKISPNDARANSCLITALRLVRRHDEARKTGEKLLRLTPKDPYAQTLHGQTLVEMGEFERAHQHFERAIGLDRTYGRAYTGLARSTKFSEADTHFVKRAERALETGMDSERRSHIHYALGKFYDDLGRWDNAFWHIRKANLLRPPTAESDRLLARRFRYARKTYTRRGMRKYDGCGHDSCTPVFVVGMPRSGTTLVEQIVASHPRGAGAGELPLIPSIERRLIPDEQIAHYAEKLKEAGLQGDLKKAGDEYLAALRQNGEGADRIVDKLPENFRQLGFLHLLFPNATIIHVHRNPLDTCLSCYFQPFARLEWASDLRSIANQYRQYRKIMKHWKKVLPYARIVDIEYEGLTQAPEQWTRRIISACGLPWDDRCLAFHEHTSNVTTASATQVRQPMYRSSVGRWSSYAGHLEDLGHALKDFLTPEDIAEFRRHGIRIMQNPLSRMTRSNASS